MKTLALPLDLQVSVGAQPLRDVIANGAHGVAIDVLTGAPAVESGSFMIGAFLVWCEQNNVTGPAAMRKAIEDALNA